MKKKVKIKINWFLILVAFCFIIFILQLARISLFKEVYGINMENFAASRRTYYSTLSARRGTIYDEEENILATDVSSYTVIAYLSASRTGNGKELLHVVDKDATAKALAPILGMDYEYILTLLNKSLYQVELGPGGRGITGIKKDEIEALNLPGIDFIEDYKRYYPNGDFASYVLGYAKSEEKKTDTGEKYTCIKGELGIESKYNEMLTGTNGYVKYQRDRDGYKIPNTSEERVDALDGSNIYLTINSNIQRFVESSIKKMQADYSPSWANITVMNAKTGDILATSSIPSFNPNIRDITNYTSPLVSYAYEPGSIMKIYSYLCAIDSGKYDGNKTVQSGSTKVTGSEIRDWNRIGWGTISLDQGFLYSSNVAASSLVNGTITKDELMDCYDKYGFGKKTNIELNGEASGSVQFNYPIEVATATFGQGITSTVMQQLQGLSIISNNGKMLTPHLVKKIVNANNETTYQRKIEESGQLVKTESISKIKDLMYQVVNSEDGNATGHYYKIDGYDIIGKTGTAQISGNNGYLSGYNDYIWSFAGMYPKDDPEIIIYASIKQPTAPTNKGIIVAVKDIITNTTKYLNLFNTDTKVSNTKELKLDSYISKDTDIIRKDLETSGIKVEVIGNGDKIISQYPKRGSKVLSSDRVILVTNGEYTMPSIIGWSRKDVYNLARLLNIKYTFDGSGYAINQNIAAGTVITNEQELNVSFIDKQF